MRAREPPSPPHAPRVRRHSASQRELPRRQTWLVLLAAVWCAAAAAAAAELRRSTLSSSSPWSLRLLPSERPSAGARAAHDTAARSGLRRALRQVDDTLSSGSAVVANAPAPVAAAPLPAPAPRAPRRAAGTAHVGNSTQRTGNSSSSSSSSTDATTDATTAAPDAAVWNKLHTAALVGVVLGLSACLCAALTPTYFFPFPFL
jgi:hypothetical protein